MDEKKYRDMAAEKYHDRNVELLRKELEDIFSRTTSSITRHNIREARKYLNRFIESFIDLRFEREMLSLEVQSLKEKNHYLTHLLHNEREYSISLLQEKNVIDVEHESMYQEKLELVEKEKNNMIETIKSNVEALFKSKLRNNEELWEDCLKKCQALVERTTPKVPAPKINASDDSSEGCSLAYDRKSSPTPIPESLPLLRNELCESVSLLSKSSSCSKSNDDDMDTGIVSTHSNMEDTNGISEARIRSQSKGSSTEEQKMILDCFNSSEKNENCVPDSVESTPEIPSHHPCESTKLSKPNNNSGNTGESEDSTTMPPPCTQACPDPYGHEEDNKLSEKKDVNKRGIDGDDQSEEANLKKVCGSNESIEAERHQCTIYKKTLASAASPQHHVEIIHEKDKPHKCPICKRSFDEKEHLMSHIRIHTEKGPFRCTFCPKRFKRVDELRKHHLSCHTDERPFSCATCMKEFILKCSLIQHIRRNHPE